MLLELVLAKEKRLPRLLSHRKVAMYGTIRDDCSGIAYVTIRARTVKRSVSVRDKSARNETREEHDVSVDHRDVLVLARGLIETLLLSAQRGDIAVM